MVRSLRDVIGSGTKTELEIGGYLTMLTADIIAKTEFGTSYETGRRIFHLLDKLQILTAQSSRHLWIPGSRYGFVFCLLFPGLILSSLCPSIFFLKFY
jgi:hypothetical protein